MEGVCDDATVITISEDKKSFESKDLRKGAVSERNDGNSFVAKSTIIHTYKRTTMFGRESV